MATSAPERLSPRAREIVAAARGLLEEEGPDALSMRRLAERLGISDGFVELAVAFESALEAPDPLLALAGAYRRFAHAHPHLYRLMTERPLDREGLAPRVEDQAAAPLVVAVDGDADLARAIWAFAHGMTILELNGRFPPGADLDAAWARGLDAFRPTRSARSTA